MYRRTQRQVSLLDPSAALPEGAQSRLESSWGEGFHREVYPLLLALEDRFSDLYGDEGRPNWSVARMVGILILQEMLDLKDQAALDQLSFDLRWHRALELLPGDAYLSRRSLVEFRARLVARDPAGERMRVVFDRIVQVASGQLQVGVTEQRLDSTHVISNIRTRGRFDLFATTLRLFVRMLTKDFPSEVARLPADLRAWTERDEERAFGFLTTAEARERLPKLAGWLVAVRDAFADVPAVRGTEPYALILRLIDEHLDIRVSTGGSPEGEAGEPEPAPEIVVRKPSNPASSLQSPHDPDAGYGYKGAGFEVQISETCNNPDVELIVDFDVHPSGCTDQGKAAEALERLDERQIAPETLYVDGGYISGASLADAEARGVDLHGPATRGPLPEETVGRDAWTLDPASGRLAACPQGHPVLRHDARTNGNGDVVLHAFMDGSTCRACPLLGQCLARPPNNGKAGSFRIEDSAALLLRDRRLTEQKASEWKKRYRIRSGIEATNSELKRKHGLGHLRVRRAPSVRLAVTTKLTACNVKRWLQAVATR